MRATIGKGYHTQGEANANILLFELNEWDSCGMASAFTRPGDDDAETILAVRSSIPGGVGGEADDAGDVDGEYEVKGYRE
jgi:hypothetical protein